MHHELTDHRDRLAPRDASVAPFAMLGALAAAVGVTAYLSWPAGRSAAARARQALIAYLRGHLGGSDAALQVVHRLAATHHGTHDGELSQRLAREFEQEREVVRALLTELGASGRSLKRAAGLASGAVLSAASGGEPDDLSLLQTLEGLAIGVQGKRCMWRALQNVGIALSVGGARFVALEGAAVRQWEAIEQRRRTVAARIFGAAAARLE